MTEPTAPRAIDEKILEENLADLYEHAPCGYISTFPDGTFAKVNQTFLAWTGYDWEELRAGKRLRDLMTVPGRIFYETHYMPLLHMQGFIQEIALDLVCRDGRSLPVLMNSVQIRDEADTPLLHRTTVFNASDRRRYEQELLLARNNAEQARAIAQEAIRIRDTFLSVASHELKSPLTALLGNAQLLQRRWLRGEVQPVRDQRVIESIIDQAVRLNTMITELLDLSRLETGQLSIERTLLDLGLLTHRVMAELEPTLTRHTLHYSAPSRPLVINGDAQRLEQVLHNLLQNAIKYSPAGGQITLQVEQHGQMACVIVADEGVGIPQAALPRLFSRFYRAENVDASSIGGLGIGLYVVKEIVTLHGGTVTVQSTEGAGSTFTVCLPISADDQDDVGQL